MYAEAGELHRMIMCANLINIRFEEPCRRRRTPLFSGREKLGFWGALVANAKTASHSITLALSGAAHPGPCVRDRNRDFHLEIRLHLRLRRLSNSNRMHARQAGRRRTSGHRQHCSIRPVVIEMSGNHVLHALLSTWIFFSSDCFS